MVRPPSEPPRAQFIQERIHVDAAGPFATGHNPEPVNPKPDNKDANAGLDSESPDHERHEHLLRTARERNRLEEPDPATDIGMPESVTASGSAGAQQDNDDDLMREAVMSNELEGYGLSSGAADGNLHFKDVPVQNGQAAEKSGSAADKEGSRNGGAVRDSKDHDTSGVTAVDYSK